MRETVGRRYDALAESGSLDYDASQRALAAELDRLSQALSERGRMSKKSALGWLLAGGSRPEPPRGLYVWGGVGRGKTMLMDLFFELAPEPKRRVHFHAFLVEVHDRIEEQRRKLRSGEAQAQGGDPIEPVAARIAAEVRLLCFDEFAVNDIADAMILGRLFERLFAGGMTVVATSNVEPDNLYEGGLNRALFIPFLALLKARMKVFHLDAPRDYRMDGSPEDVRYLSPRGPRAEAGLDAHFRRLAGGARGAPRKLVNKGRNILVPEAAGGVARFTFEELCSTPLGAGDYLKIAAAFHTLILAGLPILDEAKRNEAKRLINLVDTLYDHRIRLIVSADAEPDRLWRGNSGVEHAEFARTASRLAEMRSEAYWNTAGPARRPEKAARAG